MESVKIRCPKCKTDVAVTIDFPYCQRCGRYLGNAMPNLRGARQPSSSVALGRVAIAAGVDALVVSFMLNLVNNAYTSAAMSAYTESGSNWSPNYYQSGDAAARATLETWGPEAIIGMLLLGFAYFCISQGLMGRTPGMALTSLRVGPVGGGALTWEMAAKRSLVMSLVAPGTVLLEFVVHALTGRTIGDRWAKTRVVTQGEENRKTTAAADANDQVKKCSFCAETIKAEAVVCRHCGRDLPIGDADAENR